MPAAAPPRAEIDAVNRLRFGDAARRWEAWSAEVSPPPTEAAPADEVEPSFVADAPVEVEPSADADTTVLITWAELDRAVAYAGLLDPIGVPGPPTEPAQDSAAPTAARRGFLRRMLGAAGDCTMLVTLVAFLLLAVGPHLLGYRTATMLSGSMRPGIAAGSVVISSPTPVDQLAVGDVITIEAPTPPHDVVTHRIVAIDRTSSGTLVRTRGDANPNADPWSAQLDHDRVLRVSTVIPWLGYPLAALQASTGQVIGSRVIIGLIVASLLVSVWRRPTATRRGRRRPCD